MKTSEHHHTTSDVLRVTLLKGVAISAVVIIHTLSSVKGNIFVHKSFSDFFIFIDQLCRLSVPLFIGLSGYALTKRYYHELSLSQFFKKRVMRLIPVYLVWSISLWLLFMLVPAWDSNSRSESFWEVLLLGRGDYHLYFVPLIFQFYVLFPLFLQWLKKHSALLLITSILLQASCFILFASGKQLPFIQFSNDQAQYSFLFSWISYFIAGMYLGRLSLLRYSFPRKRLVAALIWFASLLLLTWQAISTVHQGIDPIIALKFTRLSVIPFGISSIICAVWFPWELLPISVRSLHFWKKVGEWSFVIFLSHTVVLRIIFDWNLPGVTLTDVLIGIIVVIGATYFSYKLETQR